MRNACCVIAPILILCVSMLTHQKVEAKSKSPEGISASKLRAEVWNELSVDTIPELVIYSENKFFFDNNQMHDKFHCIAGKTIVGLDSADFINLSRYSFLGELYVGYTDIYGLILASAKCFDVALFQNVTFTDFVDFEDGEYAKGLHFSGCSFGGLIILANAKISDHLAFLSVTFGEKTEVIFDRVKLPGHIYLENIKNLKSELDFTRICFDSSRINSFGEFVPYEILINKVDISKIHLDYRYFKVSLKTSGGKELTRDEAFALYEGLLKNFKDRGQLESYQKLYIEYQRYKANSGDRFDKISGDISDLWWEFGYDRSRVFFWAFFFLCIFTGFTYKKLLFLQRNVYEFGPLKLKELEENRESIYDRASPQKSLYKSFSRRLWYSFIYTGNIFFRLTLKTEQIKFDSRFKNAIGALYIIIVYVSGIVCLAYMAAFVLQK